MPRRVSLSDLAEQGRGWHATDTLLFLIFDLDTGLEEVSAYS